MAGRIVGHRYRLEAPLGRGGMATVWRGTDLDAGRPVAVKVLDGPRAAQPAALDRLRREAQTVSRLDHPNIVAGYEFGVDGDAGYLAMELVDGRSLADLLSGEGRLRVEQAIDIAAQVCAALAAAHGAGVIHRDIKPGNLIITDSGGVKVCDFGIARLQTRDTQAALTGSSAAVGTCEYMAPEQATGDAVDARTDLYSLGCVLYAMLTGRPPFLGDNPMAVLHQHLHEPPVPVGTVRADVPPSLDQLITRLVAKDPADRPASAAQVHHQLTEIRDAATAGTTTPGPVLTAAPAPTAPAAPPVAANPAGLPSTMAATGASWPARWIWSQQWWLILASAAAVLATVLTVAVVLASR
ncbi:serine/threonine-protein kinase [Actinomycetes bacterium KLBMP 9797]